MEWYDMLYPGSILWFTEGIKIKQIEDAVVEEHHLRTI
jgi:hypothetical protein